MSPRSPRSWLLELALAAGAVALGAFFTHESISRGDGPRLGVELVAGALTVVALLTLRRSRPVTLTLLLIPAGIFLGMPMGATPTALFTVGVQRPPRVAIGLAALHAVAVVVVYGLALGLTPLYYEAVTFLVLLHVSVVAVALLVRSQRQLVASWAERARQAEEGERLRVDQARRAERERVAREMHDVLAHRISLLAVHAGALEVRRGADPAEQQAAGVIRRCAHDALEDLRTVIGMLRTSPEPAPGGGAGLPGEDDHPAPTLGDVPALIEQSRAAGAQIRLTLRGGGDLTARGGGPPDPVGRHAYRIVQEALTNARRHAPGAPVAVSISGSAKCGLTLEVDNPLTRATTTTTVASATATAVASATAVGASIAGTAVAGDSVPGGGFGLVGLRERVSLAGGRLEHGPTPSGDFHLRAWLPWHA